MIGFKIKTSCSLLCSICDMLQVGETVADDEWELTLDELLLNSDCSLKQELESVSDNCASKLCISDTVKDGRPSLKLYRFSV